MTPSCPSWGSVLCSAGLCRAYDQLVDANGGSCLKYSAFKNSKGPTIAQPRWEGLVAPAQRPAAFPGRDAPVGSDWPGAEPRPTGNHLCFLLYMDRNRLAAPVTSCFPRGWAAGEKSEVMLLGGERLAAPRSRRRRADFRIKIEAVV